MATVKTAISIDKSLFEQVNRVADKLAVSRSNLFALAVEAFIQRYENEQLLRQLNQAYDDLPPADEEKLLHGMRTSHRSLVDGEW
jgi:metal-responsive CopG/Arc/MetJ family transcriptional regulator